MFMRTTVAVMVLLFGAVAPVTLQAQTVSEQSSMTDIARFAEVLKFQPLMDVMAAEGRAGADELQAGLLNGQVGRSWETAIADLYDPLAMYDRIVTLLHAELAQDPVTLAQGTVYFATPTGQKAVALEVEARKALLAPGAEAAAEAGYYGMVSNDSPRIKLLQRLVAANDLIESNVMISLNSNFAFLEGMALASGEAAGTEAEILAEVWAAEPEMREQTEVWIYPYLALAYEPMSDTEVEDYIAFSNSPAGKKLNAAIFRAFDAFVVGTSANLGKAVGKMLIGQDI